MPTISVRKHFLDIQRAGAVYCVRRHSRAPGIVLSRARIAWNSLLVARENAIEISSSAGRPQIASDCIAPQYGSLRPREQRWGLPRSTPSPPQRMTSTGCRRTSISMAMTEPRDRRFISKFGECD
jgi:hypothetical protein